METNPGMLYFFSLIFLMKFISFYCPFFAFCLIYSYKIYIKHLDRLDGLYQRRSATASPPLEKRSSNTTTCNVEEQPNDASPNCESKKKKVRWADIEENVLHLHKRAGMIC